MDTEEHWPPASPDSHAYVGVREENELVKRKGRGREAPLDPILLEFYHHSRFVIQDETTLLWVDDYVNTETLNQFFFKGYLQEKKSFIIKISEHIFWDFPPWLEVSEIKYAEKEYTIPQLTTTPI